MADKFVTRVKGILQHVYDMADTLDEKGIGEQIPFVNQEDGLRGTIKTDILLFLLRTLDREKPVSSGCRVYINECLEYDFGELAIEIARKKLDESKIPSVSILLPYFILIDKQLGGNTLSTVYIQTMCYLALGFLKEQDRTSLEDIVRYYRLSSGCIRLIEHTLGSKVDFDPLDPLDDDKKELLKSAVEVDRFIHKDENPSVLALGEALRRIVYGNEDEVEEAISVDGGESTIELIKESGDGSDLSDAAENGGEAIINDADFSESISGIDELNALIGLYEVKHQVRSLVNVLRVRQKCQQLNIKRPAITLHMVFTGNPGTGKTTVARILGKIYKETGLLSKGHLVEVGRADLVGKYVGHTAVLVKEVFEKAKGGVLFIDEAYSLTNEDGGGFGQEAVETLLKLMEDNRDDIAVIAAGYPMLMQEFLDSNPGFRSRFPFVIQFPDYSGAELTEIFECFCRSNDIRASYNILQTVRRHFDKETARKARNYADARAVRNYFEQMIMNQANRLVEAGCYGREELCEFTMADLPHDQIFPRPVDQHSRFAVVG